MTKWCSSFALVLSGCAGLPVPDVPFCRPLDPIYVKRVDAFGIKVTDERPNPVCRKEIGEKKCGFCAWTVSDKTQYVGEAPKTHLNKKPWSQLQAESLLTPSESLAAIKESYMVGCKKYGCSAPDAARWRIKLDSLDSVPDALGITKP